MDQFSFKSENPSVDEDAKVFDPITDDDTTAEESYLDDDIVIPLSFNWTKTIKRRKNGATKGHADSYIITPTGKKLRSNKEVVNFLLQHPEIPINPYEVNTEHNIFKTENSDEPRKSTLKFVEELVNLGLYHPTPQELIKLENMNPPMAPSPRASYLTDTPPNGIFSLNEESFMRSQLDKNFWMLPSDDFLQDLSLVMKRPANLLKKWFVDELAFANATKASRSSFKVQLPISPPISPANSLQQNFASQHQHQANGQFQGMPQNHGPRNHGPQNHGPQNHGPQNAFQPKQIPFNNQQQYFNGQPYHQGQQRPMQMNPNGGNQGYSNMHQHHYMGTHQQVNSINKPHMLPQNMGMAHPQMQNQRPILQDIKPHQSQLQPNQYQQNQFQNYPQQSQNYPQNQNYHQQQNYPQQRPQMQQNQNLNASMQFQNHQRPYLPNPPSQFPQKNFPMRFPSQPEQSQSKYCNVPHQAGPQRMMQPIPQQTPHIPAQNPNLPNHQQYSINNQSPNQQIRGVPTSQHYPPPHYNPNPQFHNQMQHPNPSQRSFNQQPQNNFQEQTPVINSQSQPGLQNPHLQGAAQSQGQIQQSAPIPKMPKLIPRPPQLKPMPGLIPPQQNTANQHQHQNVMQRPTNSNPQPNIANNSSTTSSPYAHYPQTQQFPPRYEQQGTNAFNQQPTNSQSQMQYYQNKPQQHYQNSFPSQQPTFSNHQYVPTTTHEENAYTSKHQQMTQQPMLPFSHPHNIHKSTSNQTQFQYQASSMPMQQNQMYEQSHLQSRVLQGQDMPTSNQRQIEQSSVAPSTCGQNQSNFNEPEDDVIIPSQTSDFEGNYPRSPITDETDDIVVVKEVQQLHDTEQLNDLQCDLNKEINLESSESDLRDCVDTLMSSDHNVSLENIDVTPIGNIDETPIENIDVTPIENIDVTPIENIDICPTQSLHEKRHSTDDDDPAAKRPRLESLPPNLKLYYESFNN